MCSGLFGSAGILSSLTEFRRFGQKLRQLEQKRTKCCNRALYSFQHYEEYWGNQFYTGDIISYPNRANLCLIMKTYPRNSAMPDGAAVAGSGAHGRRAHSYSAPDLSVTIRSTNSLI